MIRFLLKQFGWPERFGLTRVSAAFLRLIVPIPERIDGRLRGLRVPNLTECPGSILTYLVVVSLNPILLVAQTL